MTNQEVFDAALAEFKASSAAVLVERDLMTVNHRATAFIETAVEVSGEVQAGSNAPARAALKAKALANHLDYLTATEAYENADRRHRMALTTIDVAKYTMRMAIAAEGAKNGDN